MAGRRTETLQGGEVVRGAVAPVMGKAVTGMATLQLVHDPVARDLGDDAGGGNAEAERVAIDEGRLHNGKTAHGQAVDEHVIGLRREQGGRALHGDVRGAEDVDAVDLPVLDRETATKNITLALKLGIVAMTLFAGTLVIGILVRYG